MKTPLEILETHFGFTSFRESQAEIINRLTKENGHSLVLMPTGGGTIVISPLIA